MQNLLTHKRACSIVFMILLSMICSPNLQSQNITLSTTTFPKELCIWNNGGTAKIVAKPSITPQSISRYYWFENANDTSDITKALTNTDSLSGTNSDTFAVFTKKRGDFTYFVRLEYYDKNNQLLFTPIDSGKIIIRRGANAHMTPTDGSNLPSAVINEAYNSGIISSTNTTSVFTATNLPDNLAILQVDPTSTNQIYLSGNISTSNTKSIYPIEVTATAGSLLCRTTYTYYIAIVSTLPVKYLHFNGRLINNGIQLQWATASEQNSKGFYVLHSTDNQSYSRKTFINSQALNGNSSTVQIYSYTHEFSPQSNNYYQLEQIDLDGKISLSKILLIKGNVLNNTRIYPNPAHNQMTIENISANSKINIYSTVGQLVMTVTSTSTLKTIDISKLVARLYFIKIFDESNEVFFERKFLKN